ERGAEDDAQAQRERAEPSALDLGSSIPPLRDVTVGNPGRSGASLRAIRAVRKEAEKPAYPAPPSLTLRRPPPSAAYATGPAAANTAATSTPGRPISRPWISRPAALRMSRIGRAPSTARAGAPSGTRNAPRSAGSACRSCSSAPNSSASAALYSSTSPASRPPNGTRVNPEYASADTSTALRGVPRSSVRASAAGSSPSCARGQVADDCSISPPIVDALSHPL